jgi:hypothetical protein
LVHNRVIVFLFYDANKTGQATQIVLLGSMFYVRTSLTIKGLVTRKRECMNPSISA